MYADKDEAVRLWAQKCPVLTDSLLVSFLRENEGSCDFVPVASESEPRSFICGAAEKRYDFILRIAFAVSESAGDSTNIDNLRVFRLWQNWLKERAALGDYPDFGDKADVFDVVETACAPQIAYITNNNMAVYQFPAVILYLE